jgi:hypothetical protein
LLEEKGFGEAVSGKRILAGTAYLTINAGFLSLKVNFQPLSVKIYTYR